GPLNAGRSLHGGSGGGVTAQPHRLHSSIPRLQKERGWSATRRRTHHSAQHHPHHRQQRPPPRHTALTDHAHVCHHRKPGDHRHACCERLPHRRRRAV